MGWRHQQGEREKRRVIKAAHLHELDLMMQVSWYKEVKSESLMVKRVGSGVIEVL